MAFGNRYPTFGVLFASSYLLATLPGYSLGDPAALCREAAAHAAAKTGVPYDVLIAIATVETGRNNQPWPWTVNFAGEGHWYDSATDAALSVQQALSTGATNIDIGCFQLNYRWHAKAFTSVEDMLDPARNAIYAAEFLSRHYASTGDWALAALRPIIPALRNTPGRIRASSKKPTIVSALCRLRPSHRSKRGATAFLSLSPEQPGRMARCFRRHRVAVH